LLEIIDEPAQELLDFFDQRIAEFNWANWEVNERKYLAVQLKDEHGNIIAGSTARTFGQWLLIKTLWVAENSRGQNLGSKILQEIEQAGIARGCKQCLLDTLNFQAMPFYEKYGYETQWVQQNYPLTGCKYFMVKQLNNTRL
jgi:ribosomal protein S18 acetylase RimI-like enzyme